QSSLERETEPEINKFLIYLLELKFKNFYEKQKYCALCIDEICLKLNLCYDNKKTKLGLCGNWKQPITYYFTGESCPCNTIQPILFDTLQYLKQVGITGTTLVTDQGANFIQLMKNLNITVEKPYFKYEFNKIFCLYDPPQLLKSLRNNLLKYNFHFGGKGIME
ncbi:hypothetical protein ILUMI_07431, partial [Ignelater luminosus]